MTNVKIVMKINSSKFFGLGLGKGGEGDYLTTFSPPPPQNKGNMQQNVPFYITIFTSFVANFHTKKNIWMHLACDCWYLSKQIKIFFFSRAFGIDRVK